MPAAPTTNFSYDRDIAPHASKFFDSIDADPTLSHGAKMRLQGTLLGGMEGIEAQRLKLQEERDQGRQRKLQYENSVFALENARAERARREQMEARRAGVAATAKGILDGAGDPETKRQVLARTALDFAGDNDAMEVFKTATGALPKEREGGLTPNQIADFTSRIGEYVTPEDLPDVLSNPMLLGQVLGKVGAEELKRKEAKKLADDKTEAGKAQKLELAKMPLKFAKGEAGEESGWLEDSSTAIATKVVEALGNPQEKERFTKLKTAGSDRERAMMVELIQLRHRFDNERAPSEAPKGVIRGRTTEYMFGDSKKKADPKGGTAAGTVAGVILDAATGVPNTSKVPQTLRTLAR